MSQFAKLARVLAFFCIAAQAYGACPTTAPTAVSPASGQTGVSTQPTLQWSNVHADRYDIYYTTGNSCTNPSLVSPSATETGTSHTTPVLQPGTKYSWFVIPVDATTSQRCTGQVMACANFVTASSSCPANPGAPTNVSPANGATGVNSPVTFQWTAAAATTASVSYTVYASVNGGAPFPLGTTSSTSLTSNVPQGTISWAVQ